MKNRSKNNVFKFYKNEGWSLEKKNITKDSDLFEDNRFYAKKYVSNCRLRVNNFIKIRKGKFLDFASGPIQYPEYLTYSKGFEKRYCVDFSKVAIKIAKKKTWKKR